eukprot:CAMPEP_0205825068 /NCGR_PEP_ID=MMETSP0206-20130828/23801_1 /ASSEMBLY_ACC=CAM_ASM_000279 /TAXON_ID=36767 /ORGANISM="Euplotes focardii, Strain TN1" /LENGTH=76 /DNA_ID=CAMNT_0053123769 /DNA_START=11 /DNA_END=241 /DNA_ORIENTATION=+
MGCESSTRKVKNPGKPVKAYGDNNASDFNPGANADAEYKDPYAPPRNGWEGYADPNHPDVNLHHGPIGGGGCGGGC